MSVTLTQRLNAGVAASGNVVTHNGISVGTATAQRCIVVLVFSELASCTINSATYGWSGNGPFSMFALGQANQGNVYCRAFWFSDVFATTADITVTFGANPTAAQNRVVVYTVEGTYPELFPWNSGTNASTDMDASSPLTTGAITIMNGDALIAAACCATDTVGKTWANATEVLDADGGDFRFTTATRTTALTSTAVTCTGGTNGEDGALVWITFRDATNYIVLTDKANVPASLSEVTKPTVAQIHVLTDKADVPASLSEVTKPTVAQVHVLTDKADVPASLSEVTKPTLTQVSTADNLTAKPDVPASLSEVTKPTVGQTHALTDTDVASASEVSKPTAAHIHVLTDKPDVPASLSEVTKPTIGQTHVLTDTDVASLSEVTKPTATHIHVLTDTDVQSASEVTKPTVAQTHILADTNVESASEVTKPTFAEVHVLTDTDVASLSEVTKPSITQVHALADTNVESSSEVSKPALIENAADTDNLFSKDVEAGSEVTKPDIGQTHAITSKNVESGSEVTKPVAAAKSHLQADGVEAGSEVTQPDIAQLHDLQAQGVEAGSEVTKPELPERAVRGSGIRMRPQDNADREKRYSSRGVLKLIRDTLKAGGKRKRKPSSAQLARAAEVVLQTDLEDIDFSDVSRAVSRMVDGVSAQLDRFELAHRLLQLSNDAEVEEDDEDILDELIDRQLEMMLGIDSI